MGQTPLQVLPQGGACRFKGTLCPIPAMERNLPQAPSGQRAFSKVLPSLGMSSPP